MKTIDIQAILAAHPGKTVRYVFPDGAVIPMHAHVTEVGHVRKDFVDCGGTKRSRESCVLQAWVAADVNHRLDTGKLAEILAVASRHFPIGDLEVEIEYEDDVLSQFPVENFSVEDETVWFRLTSRHTDCLAKDQCGVEDGCCGEDAGSDCCATA